MNPEIMKQLGLGHVVEQVKRGECPYCNKPVDLTKFRDPLSVKDYGITGMCQSCQDEFFKPGEEP